MVRNDLENLISQWGQGLISLRSINMTIKFYDLRISFIL